MWKKCFLLLFFACSLCFSAAGQQKELWYPVKQSELNRLTTLYQNSEISRQKALLQLKKSQTQVTNLQTLSVKLSQNLKAEREQKESFEKLYNKSKADSQLTITNLTKQTVQLQSDCDTEKLKLQKTKNQRNVMFCITLILAAFVAGCIILKIKKIVLKL